MFIIYIDQLHRDNGWWKKLIRMYALSGVNFEIHCWNQETKVTELAMRYGTIKQSDWNYGTIIRRTS
jgi:hypothetical protein